ncbi:ferredoxin [Streptomyces sp. NPDC050658]|uniref:ferredoxin n=1 Tax=unclassified Streptomyces TaxID=2593676 RepID=UPI00342BC1A5
MPALRTPLVPPAGPWADPRLVTMGEPRLLAGIARYGRLGREAHTTIHGPAPALSGDDLVRRAERLGLWESGAPFAQALRRVAEAGLAQGRRPRLVVSGAEDEPSCLASTGLLLHTPHLVLDGALLAARALDATEVLIGVVREDVARSVRHAAADLGHTGIDVRVTRLNGLGFDEREIAPFTLLGSCQTYAQLAVGTHRHGLPQQERTPPPEPTTVLLTVGGHTVIETPSGMSLSYVLRSCGFDTGQGVLVGGYRGRWLAPEWAASVQVSPRLLGAHGAGALLPLPDRTCPVGEAARVAGHIVNAAAAWCGSCAHRARTVTAALARMTAARRSPVQAGLPAYAHVVAAGRGSCPHLDQLSDFVASAHGSFPEDFRHHASGLGCGRPVIGALPMPSPAPKVLPLTGVHRRTGPRPRAEADQLVVDRTRCEGHGLCAVVAPEIVRLGQDGFPVATATAVSGRQRRRAARAVHRCPSLALRLGS